jgi:hypothetical protein
VKLRLLTSLAVFLLSFPALADPHFGVSVVGLSPYPAAFGGGISYLPREWIETKFEVGYTGRGWLDIDAPVYSWVYQPSVLVRLPHTGISPEVGLGFDFLKTSGPNYSQANLLLIGMAGIGFRMPLGLRLDIGGQFALTEGSPTIRSTYGNLDYPLIYPYLEFGVLF